MFFHEHARRMMAKVRTLKRALSSCSSSNPSSLAGAVLDEERFFPCPPPPPAEFRPLALPVVAAPLMDAKPLKLPASERKVANDCLRRNG